VPDGLTEGQTFMIQTTTAGQMQVQVPPGVKGGQTIQVSPPTAAVAVPMAVPMAQPVAQPIVMPIGAGDMAQRMGAVGASENFLMTMDGIFIRQQLELLELITGCETKNRYNVVPIPAGTRFPSPGRMDSDWTGQFRAQAGDFPLLKAKEESECCERVCCPAFRSFKLPWKDATGQTFLTMDRKSGSPCLCDPCFAPPAYSCFAQRLSVSNAQGNLISTIEMPAGCCTGGCCAAKFLAKDASGRLVYKLRASACGTEAGGCANFCAPSCCNESFDVDVYGPDGRYVNTSTFVWPGCNCGGLSDLSNFAIAFPAEANAEQRATLLGGMMLIEFTINESRRTDNSNNRGGGSGGAPPANNEMAR